MSKQKNKYYVVWRGRLTGIFDSWDECRKQVEGYEGAQYKGYLTRELAEEAHKFSYWQAVKKITDHRLQVTDYNPLRLAGSSP
jgi:ribonuclease HI